MRTAVLEQTIVSTNYEQTQLVNLLPFGILNQLILLELGGCFENFLVECRLETSTVSEAHFHNKYAICVCI